MLWSMQHWTNTSLYVHGNIVQQIMHQWQCWHAHTTSLFMKDCFSCFCSIHWEMREFIANTLHNHMNYSWQQLLTYSMTKGQKAHCNICFLLVTWPTISIFLIVTLLKCGTKHSSQFWQYKLLVMFCTFYLWSSHTLGVMCDTSINIFIYLEQ